MSKSSTISLDTILPSVFVVRGVKAMLDADLAALYGVETKRLNEQVKRNIKRFPSDFMFQLTKDEFERIKDHTLIGYELLKYLSIWLRN